MQKTTIKIKSLHGSHLFFENDGKSMCLEPGGIIEVSIKKQSDVEYLELLSVKKLIAPGEEETAEEILEALKEIFGDVENNFDGSSEELVSKTISRPEKINPENSKLKDLFAIAQTKGIDTSNMSSKLAVSDAIYIHDLKEYCIAKGILIIEGTGIEVLDASIDSYLLNND